MAGINDEDQPHYYTPFFDTVCEDFAHNIGITFADGRRQPTTRPTGVYDPDLRPLVGPESVTGFIGLSVADLMPMADQVYELSHQGTVVFIPDHRLRKDIRLGLRNLTDNKFESIEEFKVFHLGPNRSALFTPVLMSRLPQICYWCRGVPVEPYGCLPKEVITETQAMSYFKMSEATDLTVSGHKRIRCFSCLKCIIRCVNDGVYLCAGHGNKCPSDRGYDPTRLVTAESDVHYGNRQYYTMSSDGLLLGSTLGLARHQVGIRDELRRQVHNQMLKAWQTFQSDYSKKKENLKTRTLIVSQREAAVDDVTNRCNQTVRRKDEAIALLQRQIARLHSDYKNLENSRNWYKRQCEQKDTLVRDMRLALAARQTTSVSPTLEAAMGSDKMLQTSPIARDLLSHDRLVEEVKEQFITVEANNGNPGDGRRLAGKIVVQDFIHPDRRIGIDYANGMTWPAFRQLVQDGLRLDNALMDDLAICHLRLRQDSVFKPRFMNSMADGKDLFFFLWPMSDVLIANEFRNVYIDPNEAKQSGRSTRESLI